MNFADPESWPPRMITSEVIGALRVSKRTFQRRCADGTYDLKPIDRCAQLIWLRADVWRLMGYSTPSPPPEPLPEARPIISPVGIRQRQLAAKIRKGR